MTLTKYRLHYRLEIRRPYVLADYQLSPIKRPQNQEAVKLLT